MDTNGPKSILQKPVYFVLDDPDGNVEQIKCYWLFCDCSYYMCK